MSKITWEEAVLWLRTQTDRQELVLACYYDDPLVEAAKRFSASTEWLAIQNLLPPISGRALDMGAGRGISSYALAAGGWEVVALEPDPGTLVGAGAIRSLAAETGLPITVTQSSAEKMDFPPNYFDMVYAREVLHHATDMIQICRNAAHVLKPGGMFLACREHVISQTEDLKNFLECHPLHRLYGGENAFLLKDYLDAIHYAGLSLERVFGPFDTPINYFPMTYAEWKNHIQSPIRHFLGKWLTRLLLTESMPWTSKINALLANRASRRDISPGRLYTFLAYKPLRGQP